MDTVDGWMDRLDWGDWPSTGPLRSMDLMECRPSFQARQRIQYDLDTAGSLYGSNSACAEKHAENFTTLGYIGIILRMFQVF